MGYIAVKGGTDAIHNAPELVEFYRLKEATRPLDIEQIRSQMRLAVDKVMGEGGIYGPEYAAIASKQSEGDVFEGAFIMRAFRATLDRRYYSLAAAATRTDDPGRPILARIAAALYYAKIWIDESFVLPFRLSGPAWRKSLFSQDGGRIPPSSRLHPRTGRDDRILRTYAF